MYTNKINTFNIMPRSIVYPSVSFGCSPSGAEPQYLQTLILMTLLKFILRKRQNIMIMMHTLYLNIYRRKYNPLKHPP